jgi:ferric-dicitrate binding protein FerR (iron transport regulator)
MTANELADINEWSCCAHSKEVSAMLRQQSDRIVALEQKHKDAFDYIEKLLKERQL